VIALRRSQVAWLHFTSFHNEFLKHYARIDHPKFQDMSARVVDMVPRCFDSDVVADGLIPPSRVSPIGNGIPSMHVHDLRGLVVKGNCVA
jgi:hypothetical protein